MFTWKKVLQMYVPVLVETASVSLLGMVTSIMVSHVGEYAMSAVSMVGTVNVLAMNIFIAVATGATVRVSQYFGQKKPKDVSLVAQQSITLSVLLSAGLGILVIVFGRQILRALFGTADQQILDAAGPYLIASAASFPCYGLFSTCNGVFRGVGDFKITLFSGILINALNAALGALFIYGFELGVLGAGLSLIISRGACGALLYWMLRRGTNLVRIGSALRRVQGPVVRSVMGISIPAAIDSLVVNGSAVLVQMCVVSLGSAAIAANAIANNLATFLLIPGNAVAVMAVTIVGQSFGAGDMRLCRKSIWYVVAAGAALTAVACGGVALMLTPLIGLYNPQPDTVALARHVLRFMLIGYPLLWSPGFAAPAALRGCGDVKFPTTVSVISMWTARVPGAWLFGIVWGMGLTGIWLSMFVEWGVRGLCYILRILSGRWARPESVQNLDI